jgi:hypothetical protein
MCFNSGTVDSGPVAGKMTQVTFCDLTSATITGTKDQYVFHISSDKQPDNIDDTELRVETENELKRYNRSRDDQRLFVFDQVFHN